MSFYSVSATGLWPNERYLYQIDPNIIDPRYGLLPIKVLTSPTFSEDHNFSVKSYNPPAFNTNLIGLSTNKPYVYTETNGELNATIEPDLSFYWTPSSLRTKNYGNMFNGILLNTSDNKHYTVVSYPSELFLYPTSVSVINNYQTLSSDISSVLLYNQQSLTDLYLNISSITAAITSIELGTPLVSSFNYVLCSLFLFKTFDLESWNELASSGEINTRFAFTSSIDYDWTTPLSSFSYVTLQSGVCAYYVNETFFAQDYAYIKSLTDPATAYYSDTFFTNKITSVDFITLYQVITSRNYQLTTNSVLLKPFDFQLYSIEYGKLIKQGHNSYLSTIPEVLPLSSNSLKSLSYTLSGAIVNSNRSLLKFTDTYNPIFENIILEKPEISIRPDTVKLAYFIQYLNTDTNVPNNIEIIGDEYDDMILNADRSIETSYIASYNDNDNKLTFQLLQSGIYFNLPMEDASNCVLSAILDLNNSNFQYINQRLANFDALYAAYTPISGVPNTDLYIRYIANTPFDIENNLLDTTVLGITSNYGNFSVNSSISVQQNNHIINWKLEYPPYYYNFISNYVDNNNQIYKNKNTLSFYLSSELIFNSVVRPFSADFTQDYAKIDLYNSIYSDFDIIELPLKQYSHGDYIKFELVFKDTTLVVQNVSAYVVFANTKEEAISSENTFYYDISSSPYIPAISGTFLRLLYDLDNSGALFSVKPSLSTNIGIFDAFWGTTFASAIEYVPRNFIQDPTIDVLNTGITSVRLSVADLTGNFATSLDLRNTFIRWDYSNSSYPLTLINKTSADIGALTVLVPNSSYLFDLANEIEITGISNEDINVTFYSEEFKLSSTIVVQPTLFDLYYENKISLNFEPINIKNKIKVVKATLRVPFADKVFDLNETAKIKWNWIYNNIEDTLNNSITAYYLENPNQELKNINDVLLYGQKYESDTVNLSNSLSTLYFLVDTNFTTNEETYPLSAVVEVYDLGETFVPINSYNIYSYPDPSIFSTDFYIRYPNFPTLQIANTNDVQSLTRPPNGTNIFDIVPYELKSENISISSLKWNIINSILPTSSIELGNVEVITTENNFFLFKNISGSYDDTILNKDFNLYNNIIKTYYNNEIFTGVSSVPVLTYSDYLRLSSYLTSNQLLADGSILSAISSLQNTLPLATSLYIITTSFNTTSAINLQEIDSIRSLNNFYSLNYTISTITELIDLEFGETQYNVYNVNYWLSASNSIISDNSTSINTFSANNIWNNQNIIFLNSLTTPTTTVEYVISTNSVEKNAYSINNVSLVAENVSITNWTNLYDFNKSIQVIITSDTEFSIFPKIILMPKHVWLPKQVSYTTEKIYQSLTIQPSGLISFTTERNPLYVQGEYISIVYDASNKMEGFIRFYDIATNILTVDINYFSGSGTYNSWSLNLKKYKETEKYVTYISKFDNTERETFYNLVSGKTYGNRLSCQEYHIMIENVQDYPLKYNTEPLTMIFGVGNSGIDVMDTQIIDLSSEYVVVNDESPNVVSVLNYRLPCYPEAYETGGMSVYVSAFNRFFPPEGGFYYYGMESLSATDLTLFSYPITAKTVFKDTNISDALFHNMKLEEYDKPKLKFYPSILGLNLDLPRIIQVKQVLEIDPIESPVEIEREKSLVVYELKSDFWTVSSVVAASANAIFDLFKLSVGDASIPLTISDFDQSTLFLTATASVATKIPPTTFNNYTSSQYTEERDIWGTVYEIAVGNEEFSTEQYKILFTSVNTLSTETQTISTYDVLAANNNIILTT